MSEIAHLRLYFIGLVALLLRSYTSLGGTTLLNTEPHENSQNVKTSFREEQSISSEQNEDNMQAVSMQNQDHDFNFLVRLTRHYPHI